jgi:hypothetical protein
MPAQSNNRRLPPLPTDRVYFADLPELLGTSATKIRRMYRPSKNQTVRDQWTRTLDIRERADGVLHCAKAAVEVLQREKWNPLADKLAMGPSRLAATLPEPPKKATRRRQPLADTAR